MEPLNDPQLSKLLREWQVENAPRTLDERVLGLRPPWWKRLITGSIRVPGPVALAMAALFVVMAAALFRPRPVAEPAAINLAGFRPVQEVQVRIIRGPYANQ